MPFKQDGAISTLNSKPLKLVDHFTYLGSNFFSTESDVNIGLEKAWSDIDRLSATWKSDIYAGKNVMLYHSSNYQIENHKIRSSKKRICEFYYFKTTNTRTHTHTNIHTYTHTNTHTNKYTRTPTHIYIKL